MAETTIKATLSFRERCVTVTSMKSEHSANFHSPTFLPTTEAEVRRLGWSGLDAILVTGDTYIDAPHIGVAVIGRVLLDAGFRVGIIAQPDTASDTDITRLGEPELFWGVTGGCVDSMVANFTASGKRRKSDDMTPGGQNTRRPDRAVIHYSNLIRRYFKGTRPIVLGGIEASLRRISHYDAWADAVRRSILFDAKADILVYGMGEETVPELARRLKGGAPIEPVRGICRISRDKPEPMPGFPDSDIELPPHDAVVLDKDAFTRMFRIFYDSADPLTARRLIQKQDTRYLIQNPPALPPSPEALDRVHELPFARDVHPYYQKDGRTAALDTIRFSLVTHRGCYGECRFCAISVHQGRRVVSRSRASILREAAGFAAHAEFKGIIPDVGGPTANMYGADCGRKTRKGACLDKGCLFPETCKKLPLDHGEQIALLRDLRNLDGVRKVFIGSGIRYDLILEDEKAGEAYLQEILRHHVSGQLKIAPEHISDPVLDLMGKPGRERLEAFLGLFASCNRKAPRKSFLTYYLMAAHPGCTQADMAQLRAYALQKLGMLPEQVQIFTPTPSTYATLMYHTEKDPFSGKKIFVEKQVGGKLKQKAVMAGHRRFKRRAG